MTARPRLADTRDPTSLSAKLRGRRDIRLREIMTSIAAERGSINVLDIGGTPAYWRRVGHDFLEEIGAQITILNRSADELSAPAGELLAGMRSEVGDACRLDQYGDNAFDFAHSNSVIEHVETWGNMKAFAAEMRRVAKSYYVQTPYFWFPLDPHYYRFPMFHWFPRPLRARFLNWFPIAYSGRIEGVDQAFDVVDRARLLDSRQFHFLFPDGTFSFERFAGLPKSMIAVRQAT